MAKVLLYRNPNSQVGNNILGVVANGGSYAAFPENHNVVQFLFKFASEVLSIQFPNHGPSPPKQEIYIANTSLVIENIKQTILPYISGKKVFFIGYSLGGTMLFSLRPVLIQAIHPESLMVLVASPIRQEMTNRTFLKWGSSAESLELAGKAQSLERAHGTAWRITAQTAQSFFHPNSAFWTPQVTRDVLFDSSRTPLGSMKLFFICGPDDEVIPAVDVVGDMDKANLAYRVIVVPSCSHNDYFTRSWKTVERALSFFFCEHGSLPTTEKARL